MLPDPQDQPPTFAKASVVLLVPPLVASDLLRPVFTVRGGHPEVTWTPVPVAAVHKDGKARSPILRLVSKATGEGIRSVAGTGDDRITPDGVAIADGKCFAVTDRSKVMAFGE